MKLGPGYPNPDPGMGQMEPVFNHDDSDSDSDPHWSGNLSPLYLQAVGYVEGSIEDVPTYDAMIMEPGYEHNGDIQDLVECLEWVEEPEYQPWRSIDHSDVTIDPAVEYEVDEISIDLCPEGNWRFVDPPDLSPSENEVELCMDQYCNQQYHFATPSGLE